MYLKSLELVGFKSFAHKTKLVFEPGMTAIVGPNGCGKSNVSDAIRWVLGEQRPKALRGSKMQDIIFNGTEKRKPLGMAEVSITFADCEDKLDTEYNEITISRRVFRSGEGQYFINKSACRLRDIQRMFMGTGIGTTSYSVMAQGQIDAILSSRPEDRRAIFEEASGITKFKADRKEAIRKLEHTEANLLRLADVIREVKRQIGSLQRQAGKARRYKELRDELRGQDLYATRQRLRNLDLKIKGLDERNEALTREAADLQTAVLAGEERTAEIHNEMVEAEREIGQVMEQAVQAQSRFNRAKDLIRINEQRIDEYRSWTERDTREISETQAQLEAQQQAREALIVRSHEAELERDTAEKTLQVSQTAYQAHRREIDEARSRVQKLREESLERERMTSRLQNQLTELEARERGTIIQRERLAAEKSQLSRQAENVTVRQAEMDAELTALQTAVEEQRVRLSTLEAQRQEQTELLKREQQERSESLSQAATRKAQIELLSESEDAEEEFPAGSRLVLDASNPLGLDAGVALGPLADQLTVGPEYRQAVETAMRAGLDAVWVRDPEAATALLQQIGAHDQGGSARFVAAPATPLPHVKPPKGIKAKALRSCITCPDAFAPTADALLANVYVVDSLDDLPSPLPPEITWVTRDGVLTAPDGRYELWRPDTQVATPLARRMLVADAREMLARLELDLQQRGDRIEELTTAVADNAEHIRTTRGELDERRHSQSLKEGERQTVERDATRSRERLATVTWELDELNRQSESGDGERKRMTDELKGVMQQREALSDTIAAQSSELQVLESRNNELQNELTECRVKFAGLYQQTEHLQSQAEGLDSRIAELQRVLQGRSRGIESYEANIERLQAESDTTREQLSEFETQVSALNIQVETMRVARSAKANELREAEKQLTSQRRHLEELRNHKSKTEIELTEARMRRQQRLDHVDEEYHLTFEELLAEPEPDWEGEKPPLETIEAQVRDLTERMDAMGPVNLIAIDEYKQLEERYTFLKEQEEDLVKAKAQIIELIRKINKQSSEMFRATFDQANINFQSMYNKLFDGGTAKLIMVDEDDVLESGIDIVARPPGKRLQNISLLSGGERTMTAVSLLFSIYMIKPSPFCLLDELDAALDDSNIGRFVGVLKEFLNQSQFVIITHNQHTIAGSDIVYGVTMPEKGVSSIVSMRLKEIGVKELEVAE